MKRYKVVGTAPVLDHQPGETFRADIAADREEFLVAIGGIEVVKAEKKTKDADERADRF